MLFHRTSLLFDLMNFFSFAFWSSVFVFCVLCIFCYCVSKLNSRKIWKAKIKCMKKRSECFRCLSNEIRLHSEHAWFESDCSFVLKKMPIFQKYSSFQRNEDAHIFNVDLWQTFFVGFSNQVDFLVRYIPNWLQFIHCLSACFCSWSIKSHSIKVDLFNLCLQKIYSFFFCFISSRIELAVLRSVSFCRIESNVCARIWKKINK